jgi:hypothetical protein
MIDDRDLIKINKMTFKELRNELVKSNDDLVRSSLIRNLMYLRYIQHLQKKQQYINNKKEYKKKQILKIKRKIEKQYKNDLIENSDINDLINDNNEDELNEHDFKFSDIIDEEEMHDNRDIREYTRDYLNNDLMERLNGDIMIKTMKPTAKNDNLIKPYTTDAGDNFAPFNNSKSQKNNFSNLKIKNK